MQASIGSSFGISNAFSEECSSSSVVSHSPYQVFQSVIQTFLIAQYTISSDQWPKDCGEHTNQAAIYDFIIIGAGAAGAILANRLSENKNCRVLLCEAGGDPPLESSIPGLYLTMINTPVDWQFRAKCDKTCKASNDCAWIRGKMLGGSTSMNFMMYVRGNEHNYDDWCGCKEWTYENCLKYFKLSENNNHAPYVQYENGKFHEDKGPLNVSFFAPSLPVENVFRQALEEEGTFKFIDDIQADHGNCGYTKVQGTVFNGIRQSTAENYLKPIKDRHNLNIIKHAMVEKILINGMNVAYGVEYYYKDKYRRRALAKKEVILSAGAIMSPVILMNSGVGRAKLLKKHNIKMKCDLPVGEDFLDHVYTLLWQTAYGTYIPYDPSGGFDAYNANKTGPLADPLGTLTLCTFFNSTNYTSEDPNVQMCSCYIPKNSTIPLNYFFNFLNYKQCFRDQISAANSENDLIATWIVNVKATSKGKISLNGNSVHNMPIIEPNHFSDKNDLDITLNALKYQLLLHNTNAYKQIGVKLLHLDCPECDRYIYGSDEYWKCYITYFSSACLHTVASCKMGSKSDPTAVVDSKLRVRCVKNLRVVDASVIPCIAAGNICASVMMVAEKAADIIKATHGHPTHC